MAAHDRPKSSMHHRDISASDTILGRFNEGEGRASNAGPVDGLKGARLESKTSLGAIGRQKKSRSLKVFIQSYIWDLLARS